MSTTFTISKSSIHSFVTTHVRRIIPTSSTHLQLRCLGDRRLLVSSSEASPSNAFESISSSRSVVTGSAKLWEDAEREEAEESADKIHQPNIHAKHENWTGEESMQDAVLRMLIDKHKPLRSGTIQSAEQKLRQAPPKVFQPYTSTDTLQASVTGTVPSPPAALTESLNEPTHDHKPWLVTFKPPSHTVNVKVGNIISSPVRKRKLSLDDQEAKKDRQSRRRSEHAQRLTHARESMLDYRMGIKRGETMYSGRPNPVSLKGWSGLVEERIEKARLQGQFTVLKGRGKPLTRHIEETNPFIAREEFLMNRIMQRNEAAPPWVELQGELDSAITTFRDVLKQSWIRRAIRMLVVSDPPALLSRKRREDLVTLRDKEWETRERSYHDAAIAEVNSLMQKYNGVAPYPVRRTYLQRSAELDRMYNDSIDDILGGLAIRVHEATMGTRHESRWSSPRAGIGDDFQDVEVKLLGDNRNSTWTTVRNWFRRTFGRSI